MRRTAILVLACLSVGAAAGIADRNSDRRSDPVEILRKAGAAIKTVTAGATNQRLSRHRPGSPRRICDHDASRPSGIACRAVESPTRKPKGLLGPAHQLHVAASRRYAVMDRNTRLPLRTGWTTIDSVEGNARGDQAFPDWSIGSRDGTDPHSRRST